MPFIVVSLNSVAFCSTAALKQWSVAARGFLCRPGAWHPPLPLPSLPLSLEVGSFKVTPYTQLGAGERCQLTLPQWSLGKAPAANNFGAFWGQRYWRHVHCSMHIICPSMPISTSTELTEFLYRPISCRKKIIAPLFWRPLSAVARGHMPLCPLPSATDIGWLIEVLLLRRNRSI